MIKKNNLLPIFLFLSVIAVVSISAYRIFYSALRGETNYDLIDFAMNPCQPIEMKISNKMAVLRIDDVQAFAWADVSKKMIDDAHQRGIVPVLGVIPKGLEEDLDMYSYLRKTRCNTEIALHGWDHKSETDDVKGEFADLNEKETEKRIEKGLPILNILNRREVGTFIPPNNEISDAARKYLESEKMRISSFGGNILDYSVTTYDYFEHRFVDAKEVVVGCDESFKKNGLCVIMTHPQDFTNEAGRLDDEKYAHYLQVLDGLKSDKDISFVTFEFLAKKKWGGLK